MMNIPSTSALPSPPASPSSPSPKSSQCAQKGTKRTRSPHCALCMVHGVKMALKGHKRYCKYSENHCQKCMLICRRRVVMAKQVKIRRDQAEDERSGRCPIITTDLELKRNAPVNKKIDQRPITVVHMPTPRVRRVSATITSASAAASASSAASTSAASTSAASTFAASTFAARDDDTSQLAIVTTTTPMTASTITPMAFVATEPMTAATSSLFSQGILPWPSGVGPPFIYPAPPPPHLFQASSEVSERELATRREIMFRLRFLLDKMNLPFEVNAPLLLPTLRKYNYDVDVTWKKFVEAELKVRQLPPVPNILPPPPPVQPRVPVPVPANLPFMYGFSPYAFRPYYPS